MQVICEGTFIEIDGPPTLKQDDNVTLEVDCAGYDSIYVNLSGRNGHYATIALSEADARHLAQELNRVAAKSAEG